MLLILTYLLIIVLSGLPLRIIVKYLQEKPFGSQFVTDHLSTDLALSVFCAVTLTSVLILVREVIGPFDETSIKAVLVMQQLTTSAIVANILSIQVGQFCNVFFAARLIPMALRQNL